MNLSGYEIALIGGGFTVIGVLLGQWLAYRFSTCLHKWLAKQAAGIKLSAASCEIMARVEPKTKIGGVSAQLIFRDHFPAQQAAAFAFEFFLSARDRCRFRNAWDEYTGARENDPGFHPAPYEGADGYKLFEQRLHAVLRFTDS